MAKNKTFVGNRKSVGTPTIGKEGMFQLMRMCRDANRESKADKAAIRAALVENQPMQIK